MVQMPPLKFLFPNALEMLRLFPDQEGHFSASEAVAGNIFYKFLAHDVTEPESGLVCLVVVEDKMARRLHDAMLSLLHESGGKEENLNPGTEGHALIIDADTVELDRENLYPGVELADELPRLADVKIQTKQ